MGMVDVMDMEDMDIKELMDMEIILDMEVGHTVDMADGVVAGVMDMAATDTVTIHGAMAMAWACITWERRIGAPFTSLLSPLIQFTNIWTQSQSRYKKESRELVISWEK